MKRLIATVLLLASVCSAQVISGRHRKVFSAGGGGGHTFAAPVSASNRCYAATTTGTSISCTLSTAPAANTIAVVTIMSAFSLSGLAVSDGTNSYTVTPNSPANTSDASAGSAWGAYRYASGTAPATITASWSGGTCSFCSIEVGVYGVTGAGAATLDMDAKGSGTGATINTPTATQSASGQLYVCFGVSENGISSATSPWTASGHGIGSFSEETEYILSSSGSQACTFAQTSGAWDSLVMSFK